MKEPLEVSKIIYDLTKDSKFGRNEQRRKANLEATARSFREKKDYYEYAAPTTNQFYFWFIECIQNCGDHIYRDKQGSVIVKKFLDQYPGESAEDQQKWAGSAFIHIDLDMFYCAVELLDNPQLRGKPVAVGGVDMICTSNYEARQYGIKAGIPGFIATKICPNLTLVPYALCRDQILPDRTHFDKYKAKSALFMDVVREVDPDMESRGLDEVSLDATQLLQGLEASAIEEFVNRIRTKVKETTGGLTCSAGVGSTRILAKIESNVNKPDGIKILWPTDSIKYMENLPIKKIHGIGTSRTTIMNAIGMYTCLDVWQNPDLILYLFPEKTANNILTLACGHSIVYNSKDRQSCGCERSFNATNSLTRLLIRFAKICAKLCRYMRKMKAYGKKITVKLRNERFITRTKTTTLPQPIASTDSTFMASLEILRNLLKEEFNIIVSVYQLQTIAQNYAPLPDESGSEDEIEPSVAPDDIVDRFDHETSPTYDNDILLPGKIRLLGVQFSDLVWNFNPKQQSGSIAQFIRVKADQEPLPAVTEPTIGATIQSTGMTSDDVECLIIDDMAVQPMRVKSDLQRRKNSKKRSGGTLDQYFTRKNRIDKTMIIEISD